MRKSSQSELRDLNDLNTRCVSLIYKTNLAIDYSHERVRKAAEAVARIRAKGLGTGFIVLRPPPTAPKLVDAQVFDQPDDAALLNEIADSCSCCGSRTRLLVALVRFASLGVEMALCGVCYQSLSDRNLGQVV